MLKQNLTHKYHIESSAKKAWQNAIHKVEITNASYGWGFISYFSRCNQTKLNL